MLFGVVCKTWDRDACKNWRESIVQFHDYGNSKLEKTISNIQSDPPDQCCMNGDPQIIVVFVLTNQTSLVTDETKQVCAKASFLAAVYAFLLS